MYEIEGSVAGQTTARIREDKVTDKNIIKSDGSCPFSVSDNLKIEGTSYDLNLEGIIIRYGSISGFRATDLVAPFHAFLMNVSDHDIAWKISSGDSIKQVPMEPNQIFFNPANVPFSNSFKKMYGMTPREFRKTIQ